MGAGIGFAAASVAAFMVVTCVVVAWTDWGPAKPAGAVRQDEGWSPTRVVFTCSGLLAFLLLLVGVMVAVFDPGWRDEAIWVQAAAAALAVALCPVSRFTKKHARGLPLAADIVAAAALVAGCGAAAALLTTPSAHVLGRSLLAATVAGLFVAAALAVLRAPVGERAWRARPVAGRPSVKRMLWAAVCTATACAAAGLLAPGVPSGAALFAGEVLLAAVLLPVAVAAMVATRTARRSGEPVLGHVAWCSAVLLLLIGLGGVLGPDVLVLPGTVAMLAAAGPLMLLLCLWLLSRGPLLPLRSIKPHRRAGVLVAAVAAPVALLGLLAWDVHGSGAYAMRYGQPRTLGLPGKCSVRDGNDGAACSSSWPKDGDSGQAVYGDWVSGSVYFSEPAWQRYAKFYGMAGGFYEPGSADDPSGIELDTRVVGTNAYVVLGYGTNNIAPLGLQPIPWLAAATPLAVLIPLWMGWNAAMRRKAHRSGAFSRPAPRPRAATTSRTATSRTATAPRPAKPHGKPKPVTVASGRARVTADHDGFTVEQPRGPSRAPQWQTHLRLDWSEVRRIEFSNDTRDPVVALFVHPTDGLRRYALDASHLTAAQWSELATGVAALTDGRITLDLAGRDGRWVNPDS
ncbi:hypothetical protein [Streptomyces sp. ME19-01-6]|uniref:hypothetical protein n=1 Tax=Streptomyces sp. ME19-01-6 TaxID=3028686 RepID=UPI0029B86C1F|nr:hypothetical protein [Streptomyces sp. ME19-01-6]MDX3228904.1 hypothetical protein [Streptomyces sp. ME19-01-6]